MEVDSTTSVVVGEYTFFTSTPIASTRLIRGVVTTAGSSRRRNITAKAINKDNLPSFFQKEGKVLHVLHNRPNPVFPKLRTTVEDPQNGTGFVVMDDVGMMDVNSFIHTHGALHEVEAKIVFRQLATAVHHCHQNNIVLRDLKLSKMFFQDLNCNSVIFGDLDGAQVLPADNPILHDQRGSPAYVGPEVIKGLPYNGYCADMWSLGVVLFRLLTGGYPFEGDKATKLFQQIMRGPAAVNFPADMDKEAQDLVRLLLSCNPECRPTSADLLEHEWLKAMSPNGRMSRRRSSLTSLSSEIDDINLGTSTHDAADMDQVVPDAPSSIPAATTPAAATFTTTRTAATTTTATFTTATTHQRAYSPPTHSRYQRRSSICGMRRKTSCPILAIPVHLTAPPPNTVTNVVVVDVSATTTANQAQVKRRVHQCKSPGVTKKDIVKRRKSCSDIQ